MGSKYSKCQVFLAKFLAKNWESLLSLGVSEDTLLDKASDLPFEIWEDLKLV